MLRKHPEENDRPQRLHLRSGESGRRAPTTEPTRSRVCACRTAFEFDRTSAPAIGVMQVLNTEVIANTMARSRALFAGSIA